MIKMASVETALSLLTEHGAAVSLPTESVPLAAASGRTLAAPLHARVHQPPADISAMDGYAVRFADLGPETQLTVIGESRAGAPYSGAIAANQCVRIFTGAHVPPGADHILIQEDAHRNADTVSLAEPQSAPSSIRRAGLDFKTGDVLIPAGHRMTPGAIALAAAGNCPEVDVRTRPHVGVLSTGDELVEPGAELQSGQVVNSIQPALLELVSKWGGNAISLGVATDSVASVRERLNPDLDLVVSIGGASVGDYDVVRSAFAEAAFDPIFEKIAVKPGKPTWFSRSSSALALGLPGNPAAALVTAHLFLKPLLSTMLGSSEAPQNTFLVPARTAIAAGGKREEYLRAILIPVNGQLHAAPAADQDSSLLHPFLSANALIRRPTSAPAVAAGDPVEVLRID